MGLVAVALVVFVSACRQPPNLVDPEPVQPFKGVRLKLAIGGGISHPHLVRQAVSEWCARTGAAVEVLPGTWNGTDPVDFAVINGVDLPGAVFSRRVAPMPELYRSTRSAYKWNDLNTTVSDRIASWDTRAYGMPLFNEGRVLVYRTDRWSDFIAAKKRTGTYPETWEELCDFAEFFCQSSGSPSLPALSNRPEELSHEFHRIAANYDRVAVSETNTGTKSQTPEQSDAFFSFDFGLQSGEPRINGAAFVHAADLLKRMQACRPADPSDDPAAAFRDGRAVASVATLDILAQLARPGSAVAGRFGFAPLPGSRFAFDGTEKVVLDSVNRVPYLGEGVWLGVVTPDCRNAEAAWDFFVEFAHPATSSLDIIAAGRWGASGFRASHFDAGNRNHWFGYGFDTPRTERLIDIQRQNAAVNVANPTLILRLPDRAKYLNTLLPELDRIVRGRVEPKAGLDEAARRWREMKPDPAIYRISLGL
jgi:ABC-type glycerol-3-phosphate transport system substrate-binding protein